MKLPFTVVLLVCIALIGCATSASRINRVSIGMSKAEVLKIMGTPGSVTRDDQGEHLNYALAEIAGTDYILPYEIRIVDGKVASYGRVK